MRLAAPKRLQAFALAALCCLATAAATALHADPSHPDPFPEPAEIQPNVEFWVRVFGEWGEGQVVVHDAEYPGLHYEVVSLPGRSEAVYTDAQRAFVDDLKESWADWLRTFEARVASGEPLEPLEQEWLSHIEATIGRDRLSGAHERVRTQRGLRERFRAGLERSARWLPQIRETLRDAGVPEDLAYLPHVESSFVPHARSSAGAVGLWQFTLGAGRRYLSITPAIDERLDPLAASRGAAAYLRDAYARLGSWPLAVTSYNHGVEGMTRALSLHGPEFGAIYTDYQSRSFGFASRNFYAEFLAVRRIASDPSRWFPEGWQAEPVLDNDRVVLDAARTPQAVSKAYGVDLATLASINPAWTRRAVERSHALPPGTAVWLPHGTLSHIDPAAVAAAWSAATPTTRTYVVRRGDTLSRIAQAHGLSVAELREWNGISQRSSLLHVGQELVIGSSDGGRDVHVVRTGDTLVKIAMRHGVKLMDLLAANSLSASTVIHPGQNLRIPSR
jgi:membrane-bound lytic murein transglycosylase D